MALALPRPRPSTAKEPRYRCFRAARPVVRKRRSASGAIRSICLYGTGIRGAANGTVQVLVNGVSVPILYAGAQPTYPGLDQVNVALPPSLAGSGEVEVEVGTPDATSN